MTVGFEAAMGMLLVATGETTAPSAGDGRLLALLTLASDLLAARMPPLGLRAGTACPDHAPAAVNAHPKPKIQALQLRVKLPVDDVEKRAWSLNESKASS